MAFPTTSVIDNFNRGSGITLNSSRACSDNQNSWFLGKINGSTDTSFDISSNALKCNAGTGDSFIATVNFGPDVEVYCTVATLPAAGQYVFLAARVKDENTAGWDGYGLLYDVTSGQWQIRRYTNGGSTTIATGTQTISAGDKIGLSVVGSTISAYRYTSGAWNQTPIVTTTDSTYPLAGKIGLEMGDGGSFLGRIDDFGGGTVLVTTGLVAKMGSFTRPGATGNQSISGLGFQPKAVIFFGNSMTADGSVSTFGGGPEYPHYIGYMDASTKMCFHNWDDYTSGNPFLDANYPIYSYAGAFGGDNAIAAPVSLDADGFTLNWTNIDTAIVVNFLALGGPDLTNAKAINMGNVPTVAGGNVAYTGVGFKPDAVLFFSAGLTQLDRAGMGMAVSPTKRASMSSQYNAGTLRYQRNDKCLSVLAPSVYWEADLASMDSDGFTLNWTTVTNTTQPIFFAVCLKGGSYHVGTIAEKTSNGNQAYTGVGFQPRALLFAGAGKTAGTSVATDKIYEGYGAAISSVSRAAFDMSDGSSQAGTRLDRTKCIVHTEAVVTPPATATAGEADLVTMDSDGFTLAWTNTDGVARESMFMAFGDAPVVGTSIITLRDNFNRVDAAALGGGSWAEGYGGFGSALEIVSNAVKIVSGSNENTACWLNQNGSDICAAFTISTLSSTDFDPFVFFARTADTTSGIQVYLRTPRNSVQLYRYTTSDITISLSQTFVAGDAIGVRLIDTGTVVTAAIYRQVGSIGLWTLVGSGTMNVRTVGPFYPGFGIYNNTTTVIENFMSALGDGFSPQTILPDADIVTTGWSTAPLFSKVNDISDASVISATAS